MSYVLRKKVEVGHADKIASFIEQKRLVISLNEADMLQEVLEVCVAAGRADYVRLLLEAGIIPEGRRLNGSGSRVDLLALAQEKIIAKEKKACDINISDYFLIVDLLSDILEPDGQPEEFASNTKQ